MVGGCDDVYVAEHLAEGNISIQPQFGGIRTVSLFKLECSIPCKYLASCTSLSLFLLTSPTYLPHYTSYHNALAKASHVT